MSDPAPPPRRVKEQARPADFARLGDDVLPHPPRERERLPHHSLSQCVHLAHAQDFVQPHAQHPSPFFHIPTPFVRSASGRGLNPDAW